MAAKRGTTNTNARGNTADREARRQYLVHAYRADVDGIRVMYVSPPQVVYTEPSLAPFVVYPTPAWPAERILADLAENVPGAVVLDAAVPACRCYRCGLLLTEEEVTADRIKPGAEGGTYRRENIRPSCAGCASTTGGQIGAARKAAKGATPVKPAALRSVACPTCGAGTGEACLTASDGPHGGRPQKGVHRAREQLRNSLSAPKRLALVGGTHA